VLFVVNSQQSGLTTKNAKKGVDDEAAKIVAGWAVGLRG
jgi:hypothetical protein